MPLYPKKEQAMTMPTMLTAIVTMLKPMPKSMTKSIISNAKTPIQQLTLTTAISLLTLPSVANTLESHQSLVATDVSVSALTHLTSIKDKPDMVTDVHIPTIHRFVTDNGVAVNFVASTSLPIVDVSVYFNAGSARDTAIRADGFGIANMTATMLTQQTTQLNEEQFAKTVEQLGINLDASAYKDMLVVSLRSLSDDEHLIPATQLLTQVLNQPNFAQSTAQSTLERNQARLLIALKRQQENPSAVAQLAFDKALYGTHPYAHQSIGTSTSIPTLTTKDLQEFYQKFIVANNANIAITGDLTVAQAKQLANAITAPLRQGKKAPVLPKPDVPAYQKMGKNTLHIPFDSTQTTVLMGQLGSQQALTPQAWQHATDFAIANDAIAGHDFNAKLMTEVRQNRGLTYGIGGGMQPMQTTGSYQIGFSTRNDKVDEAITATKAVLADAIKTTSTDTQGRLTDSDIRLIKQKQSNRFGISYASNAGINSMIGKMGFYGLSDDYWQNHVSRIHKTDRQSAQKAFAETLQPDDFLVVTVGGGIKD